MTRVPALLLMVVMLAGSAPQAAELVTLATMAVTGALDPLARTFQEQTGHTIKISYDTGPNLARRVGGGEQGDVLIAPTAVVDRAVADGRVLGDSRVSIGRVGVGVTVRAGTRAPDVSTPDALRQTLLAADAVFFSQGTSGAHVASLFTTLGVSDRIRAKTTQLPNGGVVMERIIEDRRNAIGFTMLSEIQLMVPRGAQLAGPLPASLQNYTEYSAAAMTASRSPEVSRQFVAFITNPASRTRFAATGWIP